MNQPKRSTSRSTQPRFGHDTIASAEPAQHVPGSELWSVVLSTGGSRLHGQAPGKGAETGCQQCGAPAELQGISGIIGGSLVRVIFQFYQHKQWQIINQSITIHIINSRTWWSWTKSESSTMSIKWYSMVKSILNSDHRFTIHLVRPPGVPLGNDWCTTLAGLLSGGRVAPVAPVAPVGTPAS